MESVENIEQVFERIGGFGRFQLFALFAIVFPELYGGMLGMLPVFVGGMPQKWTCVANVNNASFESTLLDAQNICECNGTLIGDSTSIVSEWNLVCDYDWVSDLVTSIQMSGMFMGGLLGSQISDWIGRKKTLYLSCLLMFVASAASSVSPSPYFYAAARFIVGYSIASYLVVGAIYPMEFFTPKWRSLSGTLGPWGEGVMMLALLAYFFPSWRTLSWITSLPMALSLLTFPFMPESPRWLLRRGKVAEAKIVFDQIARWNGSTNSIPDKIVEQLAKQAMISDGSKESNTGYIQIVLDRRFRWKIATFMGIWFSCSFIYYGIAFNTKNLSGNIYLNMVYMGLIDAIAFPTAVFAMNWMGRKNATIFYLVTGTLPLVGIVLMELDIGVPLTSVMLTSLALAGKCFISGGWSAIKCFTGESFPTSMRSSAVGICTVAAAFGGIVAPQVIFLGSRYPSIPFFIFGAFAVGSALLSFFLTETKGKPITESTSTKN